MALPPGPYDIILADPPWKFSYWSDKAFDTGRHVSLKYDLLDTDGICALPVVQSAAPDSALFLWATAPNLPDAMRVIQAWGFTYRTIAFTWVKTNQDGSPFMGMGFYTRSNAELCLLATRGRTLPRIRHDVSQVILSRRQEHSRKPDGQYDRIHRLFGPDLRCLELFARRRWPGWDAWGLEAPADPALMLPLEVA